jgi:hypothetical protein
VSHTRTKANLFCFDFGAESGNIKRLEKVNIMWKLGFVRVLLMHLADSGKRHSPFFIHAR